MTISTKMLRWFRPWQSAPVEPTPKQRKPTEARQAVAEQQMSKLCKRCGKTKDCAAFSKHLKAPDGLQTYCKACKKRYMRDYMDGKRWKRKRLAKTPEKVIQINIDRVPQDVWDFLHSYAIKTAQPKNAVYLEALKTFVTLNEEPKR